MDKNVDYFRKLLKEQQITPSTKEKLVLNDILYTVEKDIRENKDWCETTCIFRFLLDSTAQEYIRFDDTEVKFQLEELGFHVEHKVEYNSEDGYDIFYVSIPSESI